ncbi:membrane protein of ER body 2-like [Cucurbita maxima]|uniref:Membrane protein of ER body 2-like n=1 Tax=Cucurbita maxima TaxID=3661 RepID=A0A6J1JQG4_CUCMA|nr:membrane protein of ER body 2-like [Cucurbita maxima]
MPHQECLAIMIPPYEPSTRVRRRWEIRRYIVLGGLMESITSLAIVTAAMTAKISDGNIVALALTNLLAGLFVIRHDVSRLQKKRKIPRIEVDGNNYKEVLKEKMYRLLCFIIAYLSFLFFGLVPPLVYALSSLKIRNKNLKIIVAAGASLSCTALLAVQKAHINQKPRNRLVYVKTAAVDVSVRVGAFGISYLVGYMFGTLQRNFCGTCETQHTHFIILLWFLQNMVIHKSLTNFYAGSVVKEMGYLNWNCYVI